MNILICGLGSIGKRYARLLQRHFPQHCLSALRTKGQEENDLDIPELRSWDAVKPGDFQIAFITNPTYLHTETAQECALRGMHLFMEKPIGRDLIGLDRLLEAVERESLTAYVAYPLRFHPVVLALKSMIEGQKILHARAVCSSYMPSWRPGQNHRENYSAHRDQGGGVLLDLSHEIDLAAFLFGEIKDIVGRFGRSGDVTVDAEDYADLLLSDEAGVTNVHLDYFTRRPQRYVEADTDSFHVRADLIANTLARTDERGTAIQEFPFERDQMYGDQLTYFFEHLGKPRDMRNSLREASRLFRMIVAFRESA